MWLSQEKYAKKILQIFGMDKVKSVNIHLSSHYNISSGLCPSNDKENQYMYHVPDANAVGSMMYLMVYTRPDISHAVGVVIIYMENPRKEHWETSKCVLRNLIDTNNYCITFNGSTNEVCGYVD